MKEFKVTIDSDAGFCFGVENAIKTAENEVEKHGSILSLGQIVHNDMEVERLEKKGVRFIDQDEYKKLKGGKVLIRAHGEPPETFANAKKNNITLTDATCPIVIKLQERVVKAWKEIKNIDGQVVIFGNHNHPEIEGLSGQIGFEAVIIESIDEIEKIDFNRPIRLFSQTTKSKELYQEIIEAIQKKAVRLNKEKDFFIYKKSVCGQVANRAPNLRLFAKSHEVIIFVSGEKSSNGKYLYGVCKEVNPKTYKISRPEQISKSWFENVSSVGVSGATSTPMRQLNSVAKKINSFGNDN